MSDYICKRCLKKFKKKSHLVQHTEHKKVPCIPYNKNIEIDKDNKTVDKIKYENTDINIDIDEDTVDEYSIKDKDKDENENYNDNKDINLKFINFKYKYSNKYILIQKQQLNILKKIEIQEQLHKYLLKDFLDLRLEFNKMKSI
jgi:hypothetical protein